jgi:hypothetical protein
MKYAGSIDDPGHVVIASARRHGMNPRWALWEVCTGGGETFKFTLWMDQRWYDYRTEKGIPFPEISPDVSWPEEKAHAEFDAWLAAWADKDRGIVA